MENQSSSNEIWYKDGLRFSCTECGNCCSGGPGYVWVTQEEAGKIADFVKKQKVLPKEQKYLRRVGERLSLTEQQGGDCVFLQRRADGRALCRIHTVKPTQCRSFPFWESLLESQEIWNQFALECPGMNQGELYSWEKIQEFLQS